MNRFFTVLFLLLLTFCAFVHPKPKDAVVIADFEKGSPLFSPSRDGGNPPSFIRTDQDPKEGSHCVKIIYKNGGAGYGNRQAPLWLCGVEERVSFWLRKEKADEKAAFFIWLFEDDGDAWLSPATRLSNVTDTWQKIELKLTDFTFQPRGNKEKALQNVNRILLGCNFADATFYLDNVCFTGTSLSEKRKEMTRDIRLTVSVQKENLLCKDIIGLGAQWNPYTWIDIPDEHWTIIRNRVAFMRLPVARVMMLCRWCLKKDGTFDWETNRMKKLYRILDICQQTGTAVFLTDWGCVRSWTRAPGIKDTADPKYAQTIAAYLDHLINTRKYSCIQYFILVNEPNNEAGGYHDWKKGMVNLSKALQDKRLDKTVRITGSDASQCNANWHKNSAKDLNHIIQVYDLHLYANDSVVKYGKLRTHWRSLWKTALSIDPAAKEKKFIVGEAGMNDNAVHPRGNRNIEKHAYGLFMSDYAIQALNAGTHSVIAWMLDDNSHKNFFWGAWANSEKDIKLRPWFYPWALLCRYIPKGSTVYNVQFADAGKSGSPRMVRFLATKSPKGQWTFAAVNRNSRRDAVLTINSPFTQRVTMKEYIYSKSASPTDSDGLPIPASEKKYAPGKKLLLKLPAESVLIMTTLD